jgi:hypothetical protein
MAYEQRDNSGTIFKNDRKETQNQPDRTGTCMVDGVEYYISGWVKQGAKGPFMSIAFKRKQPAQVNTSTERTITQRAQAGIRKPDPISSGRQPMQRQNIIPDDDDMGGDSIPF